MNLDAEFGRREAAIQDLVENVRKDRHIVGCFLYGSTARGDFWYNSDIDIMLITTDESIGVTSRILEEGGCWFEAVLYSRGKFRRICEGEGSAARHNSRVLYCEDSTLLEYFEEDGRLGEYEKQCKVFVTGAWCHFFFQKIEKYCGRGQCERAYNTLCVLITRFAAIVIQLKGWATERELIEQALELAPETFAPYPPVVYGPILTIDEITRVTDRIRRHLRENAREIFALLIAFLADERRELPLSAIHDRFAKVLKTRECEPLYGACEMLCEIGVLERGDYEVRLTKKSTVAFIEPAYRYIGDQKDNA